MRRNTGLIVTILLFVFMFVIAGCGGTAAKETEKKAEPQQGQKKITFGVSPGPYGDMIKYAIKPGLEKKGYVVELKEFSDWVQPNLALNNKEIDANLFQHRVYMEKFSADKGLKLSQLIKVPTAGMGIYSHKLTAKTVEELKTVLKPGDEITLPNDPTNIARALRFLEKEQLITLKAGTNAAKASEKDIEQNIFQLKISPVEAAQLPRTLDSITLAVVPGNYAIAAGIPLSSAIVLEELTEDMKNIVAVRTEDLDKEFAKDIKEVVESEEFKQVIEDPKRVFSSFQKPEWYTAKWGK